MPKARQSIIVVGWDLHSGLDLLRGGKHPVGVSQQYKPDDERRIDPDGKAYRSFHDVQMIVDGEAAVALGQLVRERWYKACRESVLGVDQKKVADPWPDGVTPDFKTISVAISRTLPQYIDHHEIREVEKLYLESIAEARSSLYIENQFLSSYRIGKGTRD